MYMVRFRVWVGLGSSVCIANLGTAVHTASRVYNIVLSRIIPTPFIVEQVKFGRITRRGNGFF